MRHTTKTTKAAKTAKPKQQKKKTPTHKNTAEDLERLRLQSLNHYEREARKQGFKVIAGVDEAGRGPLAGPVVAAACIIPEGMMIPYVNDSKKLTPERRKALYQEITENSEICFNVAVIDHITIDRVNIYKATVQAMIAAVLGLDVVPDFLLVDAVPLALPNMKTNSLIKGDTLSQSIAAASIIAKETRDALMVEYHDQWPEYGFGQHKGYATAQHLSALEKFGPTPIHRKSFEPVKSMLQKDSTEELFLFSIAD